MSDPFYEACEKHSARRCMICQKERSQQPPPMVDVVRARSAHDVLNRLPDAIFDSEPPFTVPTGGGEPYQEKVMKATVRYVSAYTGCLNAERTITEAAVALDVAKQTSLDCRTEREAARNALFDLIAEPQAGDLSADSQAA